MIEINFHPRSSELRVFSLLLIPFSAFIGYLLHHWFGWTTLGWGVGGVMMTMGLMGAIRPTTVRWLFVSWMVLAFPIGWTISHLVLALVFYGIFFPFGWIARLLGYDPLQTRKNAGESYWEPMEKDIGRDRYFRQF